MNLADQIAKIRAQQPIDALPKADRLTILAHAAFLFRKFVSPISDPTSLERNLARIAVLCRLEGDPDAEVLILAARAAAQLSSSVKPGAWDDLARASGLDILDTAETSIGLGGKSFVAFGPSANAAEGFVLSYRGQIIQIVGGARDGEFETESFQEACQAIEDLAVRTSGGKRHIEIEYGRAPKGEDIEIFDTVHDPWRPTRVFSDRLKSHPTAIIEPSTLAATTYPVATYKPMVDASVIERGFISDAQFETIVYCLQAITSDLPGSPNNRPGESVKGGFIIGDGTGVGKTNEFCAVIMDQWLRGVKRHIVVVERSSHVEHINDAWAMVGGDPKDIMFQGERDASSDLPSRDGIMVTTYALLRDDRRYSALLEWANEHRPCNGVLVFDEAHNMRNAVEDKFDEGAGKRNRSQQGMRGVELQDALPRAGVIYASATMATDVYNLGYATRLGLWGKDAPFSSSESFITTMHGLDEAALEQVCIDLKAAGRYCSRTLSFDGVEFEEIEHVLTPRQRERFDLTVTSYRIYSDMARAAMGHCCNTDMNGGKSIDPTAFNAQRDTIEALLSVFNTDRLIEDIHDELARGNAPVVQIAMTGEARLKRMVGENTYMTLDEYKDNRLEDRILATFPIHYRQREGKSWELVLDSEDQPIECPEAVKIRDDALAMARKVATGMNVIDRLLLEFGADNIAEKTGRSLRMIPDIQAGKHVGWHVEERSPLQAAKDVDDFQQGKKSILVFSVGAGGTGLSYHAAKDAKNQARRVHYLLEMGRRAESAVQGIGRTHRSGQVIPPLVKMVTSDVPAHMIYASRTLSKIAKMGALSRGHQHATSNAIFEQRIPLHSRYAAEGWQDLLTMVRLGKVEDTTIETLAQDLQLGDRAIDDFNLVLNRLCVLTTGQQKNLVGILKECSDEAITKAIRSGTYNQGLETIKADSIELIDENEIENTNGSITKYYRLRRHDKIERTPFTQAAILYARSRSRKDTRGVFMRHKVSGRIALGITNSMDSTSVDITTPGGSRTRAIWAIRAEPWKIITDLDEAKRYWELESESLSLEEYTDMHMLSGSLLYNWDKLPKGGIGLNRCKTDAGKVIVGRLVAKQEIRKTLQDLGMQSNFRPAQIAKMLAKVDLGASIQMDNGWSIDRPENFDVYRLNIPDEEMTGLTRQSLTSIGVIAVTTPLGIDLEIPKDSAIEVIQKLGIGTDLTLEGLVEDGPKVTLAA